MKLLAFLLLTTVIAHGQTAQTLKGAYQGIFRIGAALNPAQFEERDARGNPIIAAQFNTISPENALKWGPVHPKPNAYNFGPADEYVAFGEKHKMFIIGHCLVWHSQTPQWVFEDAEGKPLTREALLERMHEHIRTVVGRYKGRIGGWDVVNEALKDDGTLRESPWYRIIGDDYIQKAFEFAHAADPGAELYYNDYSLEENEAKRNGAVELIRKLRAAGTPITGIGLQGHLRIDSADAREVAETIETFGALGIRVNLSELDVDVLPPATRLNSADISATAAGTAQSNPYTSGLPEEMQEALAKRYAELFRVFVQHRGVMGRVTFWGVTDGDSWLNNFPVRGRKNYPLLFDREGQPKLAFDAVLGEAKTAGTPVAAVARAQTPATLAVDLNKPKAAASPILYGLMTEEINYSYDGGLYAELIRNRTFRSDWTGILNWFVVEKGTSAAKLSVDVTTGPSTALSKSAKLEVIQADAKNPAGILNEGYWGIAVRPRTLYTGSFFAKSSTKNPLPLRFALVADVSGKVLASASVSVTGNAWKEYKFIMQSGVVAASAENHLELTVEQPATLWLQLVSLFPPTYHDRPNGNRADLMEKLAAMKPSFLRFPGGNYLEGGRVETRFDWKKMIGPLVDRPTHPSTWNYHSTDGMGLLEFLEWCEDLHMRPVLAVYAGYSLGGQVVKPGPELDAYVRDAVDEIEYVTGAADTKWGSVRAKDGHPAPFPLHYVEVGNEDNFDRSKSYDGRYAQFYKGIKAKYPDVQIIATMPVSGITPDVVDDHYYKPEDAMFELAKHYDAGDRKGPKIFVGEWATREGSPTPNFGAALGDAAFMTGLERNSDLVIMASYAPLLVNVNPGGMQWSSDLMGYDALKSYGSPSYYAQVMFSSCLGDHIADANLSGGSDKFFYSVTTSAKSKVCIKLVNAASTPQAVTIALNGLGSGTHTAHVQTLSANTTWATNSITEPTRIVPLNAKLAMRAETLKHTLAPYSIEVLEVDLK